MPTIAHSALAGSDMHEPKGVDTATAGQVYISDGVGSGAWTDTGATIGTSNFTTGDLKPTLKVTADSGWIMADDGTIGSLASGASTLASATAQDLFYLLWNNYIQVDIAVSGGRGVSAAADWTANKTIALPKMMGRVFGVSGTASGLTSRQRGRIAGAESVLIGQNHLPAVNFVVTIPAGQGYHTHSYSFSNVISEAYANQAGPSGGQYHGGTTGITSSEGLPQMTGVASSNGAGHALSILPPTNFLQMMIKL